MPATQPHRLGVRRAGAVAIAVASALLVGCASDDPPSAATSPSSPTTSPSSTTPGDAHDMGHATMRPADRAAAQLATAAFQDLGTAESAGYAETLDTLGCFQDPSRGGMGVHYLDEALMDATVDLSAPEALVYELDADRAVTGLVAHEYIVPVDAWTSPEPPSLFGVDFNRHPSLPLWVLHAWLWKDNPAGVFSDWNPAVRLCPDGVPIFGVDLPRGG